MRRLVSVCDRLADVGGFFSALMVVLMTGMVMAEVFMRYVLHNPPGVADEISAYMFIAIVFMGLSYTWKKGGHVRIELVVAKLSTKASRWLRLATLIVALAYVLLASQAGWVWFFSTAERGLRSQTWLRVPMQWPGLPLAIGFSLLFLQLIVEVWKVARPKTIEGGKQDS